MFKQAILASALLVGAATSASAVTLFSDNFDAETQVLNGSLSNWAVSDGTIDVIGTGFFDFYPGNGNYLDMDGSTGNAGRITTNQTFNLQAGQSYSISFDAGVNTNGGGSTETISFGIGSYTFSLSLTGSVPNLLAQTFTFLATANESGALFFEGVGTDNNGFVIDEVSLSAVPLPAAAPLFIMGLAGLAAMARRRRTKVSV